MRWAAVVITGLAGALIANGCLDDPTFIQAATDGGGEAGTGSSTTSSTGGTSASSSSTSSSSSSGASPSTCGTPCTNAGGVCDGATCTFRCPAADPSSSLQVACMNQITCLPGADCIVTCSARNACKKITCINTGNDCSITCSSDTACSDQITSLAATTEISCNGNNACTKVDCEGNGSCAVTCGGPPACMPAAVKCCSKEQCTVNNAPGTCK